MVEYLKNTDFIVVLLLLLMVIGCGLILWHLRKYKHLLSKTASSTTNPNLSNQNHFAPSALTNTTNSPSLTVDKNDNSEYFKQMQDYFQAKKNEFSKLAEKHQDPKNSLFDAEAIQKRIADDKPFHTQVYANKNITQQTHRQDTSLLREMHSLDHQLTQKKAKLSMLLRFFDEHHQEKKYAYQRQVGKLGSSYDHLKKELQNGTIRENKQEWAQRYCHIFDEWIAKGSPHALDKLKAQIVDPIKELNKAHPDNEFTPVLSSDVTVADQMYTGIQQLPQEIVQKLQDLSHDYGKVSALLDQVIPKKVLDEEDTKLIAPVNTANSSQSTYPEHSKEESGSDNKETLLPTSKQKNQLFKNGVLSKFGRLIAMIALLASAYYGFSQYKKSGQNQNNSDRIKHFLTIEQHHTQLASFLTAIHQQQPNDSTYQHSSRNSIAALAPYYGIDVSHLQDHINWTAVSENSPKIDFALIKATEGTSWRDPFFTTNWQAAKAQFPVVGAYHFFNHKNPQQQAANFIEQVPKDTIQEFFFPIVDVEKDSTLVKLAKVGQLTGRLQEFIKLVEAHYGRKVIIYSGQDFYQRYLRGYFPRQLFWLAHYCQCDDVQNLIQQSINQPETTERVVAWQFTDKGQVEGIKGNVDLNYVPAHFWQQVVGQ